jgi:hypothetical protein
MIMSLMSSPNANGLKLERSFNPIGKKGYITFVDVVDVSPSLGESAPRWRWSAMPLALVVSVVLALDAMI